MIEQSALFVLAGIVGFLLGYMTKQEKLAETGLNSIKDFSNMRVRAKSPIKLKPRINDDEKMSQKEAQD